MGNQQGRLHTLKYILDKADLPVSQKAHALKVLATEPYSLQHTERNLSVISEKSLQARLADDINIRQYTAMLAVLKDFGFIGESPNATGTTLGACLDQSAIVTLARRPIVESIMAKAGFDRETRCGPAAAGLTREALQGARGPDGVQLTPDEISEILRWAFSQPADDDSSDASEDNAEILKLRREYEDQIRRLALKPAWAKQPVTQGLISLLLSLAFDSRRRDKLHTAACHYYAVWVSIIAWILLLTSTGATIAAAISTSKSDSAANKIKIATLVLTAVTALASGWTTIVSPASKSEKHRAAAAKYYKLASEVREYILDVEAQRNHAGDQKPQTPSDQVITAKLIEFRKQFHAVGASSPDCPFWAIGQKGIQYKHGNPGLWAMTVLYWALGPFCGSVVGEAGGKAPSPPLADPPV